MRNKQLLLILITAFPFAGFSQRIMTTYYDYKHTQKHEVYTVNSYGVKTGTYTEYSQYGGVLTSGTYSNDNKVGKWSYNDDKGKLVLVENYDNNGAFNGLYVKYENGNKTYESNYLHGNKIYDKEWYEDGAEYGDNAHKQLHYVYYYNKTYQSSYDSTVEYRWKENGNISEIIKYFINGVQTSQVIKVFDKQGNPLLTGKYLNGSIEKDGVVKNGEEKEYDENGSLLSVINYKNGVPNGECVYYAIDGSGVIMMKGQRRNDTMVGEWKQTYNGVNKPAWRTSDAAYYRVVNYSNKNADGSIKATDYYMTGEKQSEEAFNSNGIFIGAYKEYYRNGQLSLNAKYNAMGQKDSIWDNYSIRGMDSVKVRYINDKLDARLPLSNK